MTNLSTQFQQFIQKHQLFSNTDSLLVAVSGGVDSIVICHLLQEMSQKFAIAHCNFQLRGEESDKDEELVKSLADQYQVPFHTIRFETGSVAEQKKISTQMAARELRYDWFEQLMNTHAYGYLVTAHHSNDLLETALFNFTKGTGIAGLRGIKRKKDKVIRPLSFASKKEILHYAKAHKLIWREDASNESNKYHRNRIRNLVIPELKKINPGLEKTYAQNQERFESLELLLKSRTQSILKKFSSVKNDVHKLDMSWMDVKNGGLVILEDILRPYGFNLDQCKAIITALSSYSGKRFTSEQSELIVDRDQLVITPIDQEKIESWIQADDQKIEIGDQQFSLTYIDLAAEFSTDPNLAYLDADLLKFPLKIRNWEEGDRFYPLGMKQQKKISDFMIDAKIPLNLKNKVLLFESNNDIIWVAGHRIDDRYKITDSTKRTLIIKMERNV
ncbi:tRNA lysidine(34) synthetase TilS [Reichenbachiella ulvae]|uniref:tRNA(Ile)-lysidine synthase n=1 Tax=Reichenbachiella ulvae TaxID=2980104 RepID=A0ABT3D0H4_9BACT|nr:tRNA lysidine(34) synthetase TilS [Reichenbachiella ulvae]MCV9389451.1 tRNA lysidine(34) synthetase TilS [Reichenbachiella ulvae]